VTKPTTAQTRQAAIDSERLNIASMRDALIATGIIQGFNYAPSGGTPEQPASIIYTRGAENVAVNLTWGAVGGDAGNVMKMAFYYNDGQGWLPMIDLAGKFVANVTYDANGNCNGMNWTASL
jgi:hypothetical protein